MPEPLGLLLNDFVQALRHKLDDVKVYLFGSYSKGEWIEDSDIDLIVVSDQFLSLNIGERARLVRGLAPKEISFHLILYTYEEFKRARKSLSMKDIVDSCIRIV